MQFIGITLLLPLMIRSATSNDHSFVFSVVIPIYNTEEFLEETLQSIIHQSIGFASNIQIILVNDGSTDGSEAICLAYRDLYPENVMYLKSHHCGAACARNIAIPYITGLYVTFHDSDDLWDHHAFERILSFFNNHRNVDVVSGRIRLFGAWNGYASLDYKFTETKSVDLIVNYTFIQPYASSSFIRSTIARQHRFPERVTCGEDSYYIHSILLNNPNLGLVREAIYSYRRREKPTSTVQTRLLSSGYYFDSQIYFVRALFQRSIELYGRILPFIQFVFLWDLQWRIQESVSQYLHPQDYLRYCSLLIEHIQNVDDQSILALHDIPISYKVIILSKKYNEDIRRKFLYDKRMILYHNLSILDFGSRTPLLTIDEITVEQSIVSLRATHPLLFSQEDCTYYLETSLFETAGVFDKTARFHLPCVFGQLLEGNCVRFIFRTTRHPVSFYQFTIHYQNKRIPITVSFKHPQDFSKFITLLSGNGGSRVVVVLFFCTLLLVCSSWYVLKHWKSRSP